MKRCWTKPCRSLNSRPDVETSAPARRFKSVVDGLASQSLIVKESSTRDSHTFSIVTVLSAVPWEASKASAKLFRDRNVDRSHPWHVREFRSDHGKTDALIFRPRMRTGRARPRQFPCGASYLSETIIFKTTPRPVLLVLTSCIREASKKKRGRDIPSRSPESAMRYAAEPRGHSPARQMTTVCVPLWPLGVSPVYRPHCHLALRGQRAEVLVLRDHSRPDEAGGTKLVCQAFVPLPGIGRKP